MNRQRVREVDWKSDWIYGLVSRILEKRFVGVNHQPTGLFEEEISNHKEKG